MKKIQQNGKFVQRRFQGFGSVETSEIIQTAYKRRLQRIPAGRKYLLCAQLKDSSRSVTANMAEGYGRFNFQETTQFFRQSRGSLNETLDHLITAYDEGYICSDKLTERELQYQLVLKLINGYISFLQKSKSSAQTNSPESRPKK